MRHLIYICLISSMLLTSGCAIFNRNNTPALNFVERHLVPDENPGRAASYALLIPVGTVAATIDMFILHPASVIGDSWEDTSDILWRDGDWNRHYATNTASLVPRTVLTPLIFTGDLFARSTFDISRNHHHRPVNINPEQRLKAEREKAAEQTKLLQARQALENGKNEEAIRLSNELLKKNSNLHGATIILATALLNSGDLASLEAISPHKRIFEDGIFLQRFTEQLSKSEGANKVVFLNIIEKNYFRFYSATKNKQRDKTPQPQPPDPLQEALKRLSEDEDRAIRLKTLQVLAGHKHDLPGAMEIIIAISRGSDPVMAQLAIRLIPKP